MNLIQFRIRSHPALPDSGWLAVKPGINLLSLKDTLASKAVLHYLPALNPPDDRHLDLLDQGTGVTYRSGPLTRRVIPHKKTAVIGVFTAEPPLINTISTLDESLFQTDRIEVGRRLDRSRWMNFVEISSSTRWNELASPLHSLLDRLEGTTPSHLLSEVRDIISPLKDTDRLRRGLDDRLLEILNPLAETIPPALEQDLADILYLAGKSHRFAKAKRQVFDALPIFRPLPEPMMNKSFPDREEMIPKGKKERTILLLDGTSSSLAEIRRWCKSLNTLPVQQAIVAIPFSLGEPLASDYRIIMPPK